MKMRLTPPGEESLNYTEKPESVELFVTDRNKSATSLPPPHGLLSNTNSLIDTWNAVKDYNLRTGIPNLEQLLSGKGRPPLDAQNFGKYVESEDSVGTLLLDFYKRVVHFEEHCVQHEHRYPIPPQTSRLNLVSNHQPQGRCLVPTSTMSLEEANELKELSEEARSIVNDFLDPRSNRYFGCPSEFLWRARAGLDSTGAVPWSHILSPAKQHAFNSLNTHFYESFVKHCFHTNLSTASAQLCLFAGSLILVFALTLPLSMVFCGLDPRSTRLALLPFAFFGTFFLLASYTRFLPYLGLRHLRETAFRTYEPLVDPLVIKSHSRRSLVHLSLSLAASAIIAIIFLCLPGNHLMREVRR